ncbi:hypothetical protein AVEN_265135-1, partial [Araneus ventricosus]
KAWPYFAILIWQPCSKWISSEVENQTFDRITPISLRSLHSSVRGRLDPVAGVLTCAWTDRFWSDATEFAWCGLIVNVQLICGPGPLKHDAHLRAIGSVG